MGSGHITEVVRNLEEKQQEKIAILKYFQSDESHKKQVDTIISNERYQLKIENIQTGNIWVKAEILNQNIEKLDKEISLYEKIKNPRVRP